MKPEPLLLRLKRKSRRTVIAWESKKQKARSRKQKAKRNKK
jgi:hypothetical protein